MDEAKKGIEEGTTCVDYGLAVVVSDRVSIEDVRLIAGSFRQAPGVGHVQHSLEIDCTTKVQVDKEGKCVLVFPTFELSGFPSESKPKEVDLVITATFLLAYKVSSLRGLKKENYEAFAESNGVYNAWPYWREYVQSMIARMNLPPLTIPVFRLVAPRKQGERVNTKTTARKRPKDQGNRKVSKRKTARTGKRA